MGLFDFLDWVRKNPDGTITRLVDVPTSSPTGIDASVPVQSIDVPLNTTNNTWVRIFRPTNVPPNSKLPLVIYFHGGGFVYLSAATTLWHEFCVLMANELNVVVVSLEYRLTPENRLPAAYDDAMELILWMAKKQALDHENYMFIKDIVDFSKCFVMGTSAGGNMAYHVGLRALNLDLGPLKIIGLILDHAFFGGVERTGSEIRLIDDEILPLPATDLMWELSLPVGADRDHEYSNPTVNRSDGVGLLPWCLVRGYEGDPLIDRMKEVVKLLEGQGVKVVGKFYDGGFHAMEVFYPKTSQSLLNDFKEFIYSTVCN